MDIANADSGKGTDIGKSGNPRPRMRRPRPPRPGPIGIQELFQPDGSPSVPAPAEFVPTGGPSQHPEHRVKGPRPRRRPASEHPQSIPTNPPQELSRQDLAPPVSRNARARIRRTRAQETPQHEQQVGPADPSMSSTPRQDRPRAPPQTKADRPNHADHSEIHGPARHRAVPRASLHPITQELKRGYECMVCMSDVRFFQSVWSCKTCCKLFHLKCMHQWITRNSPNKPVDSQKSVEWRCPGCQYVYVEPRLPQFECFCGRIENPPLSRSNPFSCGEACSRPRPNCSHPCTLQCHPGNCPPCTCLLQKSYCFCGAHPIDGSFVKCGDPRASPYACENVCGRLLNCGEHTCGEQCHEKCGECKVVVSSIACACGALEREVLCGSPVVAGFSCGTKTSVLLECGTHSKELMCGATDKSCPYSPEKWGPYCQCRQTHVGAGSGHRERCSDPIPVCDKETEFTLSCGHSVSLPCQLAEASASASSAWQCTTPVVQHCRCSRSKRTVPCHQAKSDPFACKTVCRTYRTCLKCKCDVVCCPDFGKKDYSADSHICFTLCGKTLACGIHQCDEIHHLGNCKRCAVVVREPLTCGCGKTRVLPPFQCGSVGLPVCNEPCNKTLPCGHKDLSRCHTGTDCAPCSLLVSKPCAGGHGLLHQIPCFAEKVSCAQRCGKKLNCGIHACRSVCHAGPCAPCTQACGQVLAFCEHSCTRPCSHGDPACDDCPCSARIVATCSCGLRTDEVVCGGSRGNPFPTPDAIECTAECAIAQRQAMLRSAFRSDDASTPTASDERYSGELLALAEKFDKFVRLLDLTLVNAAMSRTRTVHLPPTDSLKRYLTLEYCQVHFRFECDVVKEGDGVQVTLHFVAGETRVPSPTLTALLDMMPSQALQYTVDFDNDGPKIHLYDVARGRLTQERISKELKPWVGQYRSRRSEKPFELFLDFLDGNVAMAAFRKLQAVSGLDQCRLLNVFTISSATPVSPAPVIPDEGTAESTSLVDQDVVDPEIHAVMQLGANDVQQTTEPSQDGHTA